MKEAEKRSPQYLSLNHCKAEKKNSPSKCLTNCYASLSHLELVAQCGQSTDHALWQEFYCRFGSHIYHYVKRALKNRVIHIEKNYYHDLTLDLVQDVYLLLLDNDRQALSKFRGENEASFFAYLNRIANNAVAEYLRRKNADKRHALTLSIDNILDDKSCRRVGTRAWSEDYFSHDSEKEMLNKITLGQLSKILNKVLEGNNSRRNLFVFELYFINGLSIKQISEIPALGLKPASVESLIRRIRAKLFQVLDIPMMLPYAA